MRTTVGKTVGDFGDFFTTVTFNLSNNAKSKAQNSRHNPTWLSVLGFAFFCFPWQILRG
jgi:hypothetical protein